MLLGELTALGMVDKPEVHSVCKGSGSYSKIPVFPSSRKAESGGSLEPRSPRPGWAGSKTVLKEFR